MYSFTNVSVSFAVAYTINYTHALIKSYYEVTYVDIFNLAEIYICFSARQMGWANKIQIILKCIQSNIVIPNPKVNKLTIKFLYSVSFKQWFIIFGIESFFRCIFKDMFSEILPFF